MYPNIICNITNYYLSLWYVSVLQAIQQHTIKQLRGLTDRLKYYQKTKQKQTTILLKKSNSTDNIPIRW